MLRLKPFLLFQFCFLLLSCSGNDETEDLTTTVNKNGAVESAVTVVPLDSAHNVLVTTHKVWLRNAVFKTIEYRDTLPALGTETATAENEDGDTKTVSVKKDYEIYITVK